MLQTMDVRKECRKFGCVWTLKAAAKDNRENEIHNLHGITAVLVLVQQPYGCCYNLAATNAARHNPQIVQVGTFRVRNANKLTENFAKLLKGCFL